MHRIWPYSPVHLAGICCVRQTSPPIECLSQPFVIRLEAIGSDHNSKDESPGWATGELSTEGFWSRKGLMGGAFTPPWDYFDHARALTAFGTRREYQAIHPGVWNGDSDCGRDIAFAAIDDFRFIILVMHFPRYYG